jgi:3-hydroxyisobutyrate dehydrogenase-like beta-hydroxyacid dehydrogenase
VTTVGVIGLGDIGSGVARGMATGGLDLVVYDIVPESMARFEDVAALASSPEDVGSRADVIVTAVFNDAQVLEVMNGPAGALGSAKSGTVVVIVSTVSVATLTEVAEAASRRGVDVLDCGVSGGPAAAAEGSLVSMIGGEEEVIDRIRPVLDAFSSLVVHMGPLGAGLRAKLARNVVQYGSWLAAYEAQLLAEAAGIELSKLAEVIRASDPKIGGASRLMFRATVAPFTDADHPAIVAAMTAGSAVAHKDLGAALALAEQLGIDLPMTVLTADHCDRVFGVDPQAPNVAPS